MKLVVMEQVEDDLVLVVEVLEWSSEEQEQEQGPLQ
jgi:hypothetical protein